MCGIAGFLRHASDLSAEILQARVQTMADSIQHRGPDSAGYFVSAVDGLALAHRRLAIIDLSPAGHQPMLSACGRYCLVYNGEVYNHEALRANLKTAGINWRGHSDTEVIVEHIARYGVKATVSAMGGMFAFALWDQHEKTLTLCRDRIGVKPLYWSLNSSGLYFGSELKTLLTQDDLQRNLHLPAVTDFLQTGYISGTQCIWQNVQKLAPGSILTWRRGGQPQTETYWNLRTIWQEGQDNPTDADAASLQQNLHALLKDAVKSRMMADVPLGAFLSGGIDSSLVASLMQAQADKPIKTFTIGFHDQAYNEAQHAKAVAAHLGTDHTELYLTEQDALNVIPLLPDMYDEPFADHSQIPTYLVSKMARQQVTVALSGDGGDEFFAGYNRYTVALKLGARLARLPRFVRAGVAATIGQLPPQSWNRLGRPLPLRFLNDNKLGERLYKLRRVLKNLGVDAYYGQIISHWQNPADLLQQPTNTDSAWWLSENFIPPVKDPLARMQLLDALVYLPDDVMTKVDRASMAVALEAREPLLDHRLIEFASRLKPEMKIRDGNGKWLLRQILYDYVPQSLIDRPKMGFGVPIGGWLKGPLRDWAEDLLSERSLTQGGVFKAAPIREKWQQHISGQINWEFLLWDILMFQAWQRRWAAQP